MAFGETFVEDNRFDWATIYKFNGKEQDCESGLYNYGARYYDPKISRWLSVDPLSDSNANIGYSPYIYVWNNPVVFNDPTGMQGENTIYKDENGNELGRTEDNFTNAVIIVKDIDAYNKAFVNGDIAGMRASGDNYMVNEMWDFYDQNENDIVTASDKRNLDSKGNPLLVMREHGSVLVAEGNIVCIDPFCNIRDAASMLTKDALDATFTNSQVGHAHTHDAGKEIYRRDSRWSPLHYYAVIGSNPSPGDWRQLDYGRQNGYWNVVITKNIITFYGRDKYNSHDKFTVNRTFFKK